jgi:hypothetical protein
MVPSGAFVIPALVFLFAAIVACGAVGGVIAYCAARIQQRQAVGWRKNSILSASGFLAGLYVGLHIVYPTTISYTLGSGVSVTDTERYYRHPQYVGYILAVVLPVILELGRLFRARRAKAAHS